MKKISSALLAAALVTASTSHAAGFALIEQSASGMGNAFAGGAAGAEDASTIFFNPAGMTYLPDNQLVIAVHVIKPSVNFSNNGSHSGVGTTMTGGNGGDAGDLALAPNFYFTKAVSDSVRLGIGVNAPFGLKTEYDSDWAGRYQALKSELKTININPSVAFKVNNMISLGAGVSYQRAEATLTNAVDFGTICAGTALKAACAGTGVTPQKADGLASIKGDDWSWGYNLGAILQPGDTTRIGLAYRSEVRQNLSGSASFGGTPALFGLSPTLTNLFANGNVTAKLTLPASFSASIFQKINAQWDVMGDLTWTEWSSFNELRVIRSSGPLAGQTLTVQPENWSNSVRASIGASYRYNDKLKARIGVAFDESPVSSTARTPRIPDTNRTWLSLGANYRCTPESHVDIGYSHIFVKDATLSQGAVGTPAGNLVGNYNNDINILSLQYTHTF